MSGLADFLDEGNWNARCSLCNRKRKASELVKNWQGMWRCPEHNEPRQPQDFVRGIPDIQTPPWIQHPSDTGNSVGYLQIEESDTAIDLSELFTDTYTGVDGQLSTDGITTVIVTIVSTGAGTGSGGMGSQTNQVIIDSLTTGTGWPSGVTTVIINVGEGAFVLSYTNDTVGVAFTVNVFPGGSLETAGDELEITGGTDVNVLMEAAAEWTTVDEREAIVDLTVTVTGNVTHLIWGSPWAPTFPNLETFTLVNEATIFGRGGAGGGDDNDAFPDFAQDGAPGEDAITLSGNDIDIDNSAGNIWGGGGGGGFGGLADTAMGTNSSPSNTIDVFAIGGPGGGGAGGLTAAAGTREDINTLTGSCTKSYGRGTTELFDTTGSVSQAGYSATISQTGTNGTAGTSAGPGSGGAPALATGSNSLVCYGGAGGDGGAFGAAGSAGAAATSTSAAPYNANDVFTPGSGGAAGKAIALGGGSVTWIAGNNSTQVKGAVS